MNFIPVVYSSHIWKPVSLPFTHFALYPTPLSSGTIGSLCFYVWFSFLFVVHLKNQSILFLAMKSSKIISSNKNQISEDAMLSLLSIRKIDLWLINSSLVRGEPHFFTSILNKSHFSQCKNTDCQVLWTIWSYEKNFLYIYEHKDVEEYKK